MLLLKADSITWPGERERRVISSRIASRSTFQHCVEFLDGIIFLFESRLEISLVEDHFSRNSNYGLNAQVVCDDQCRIRYVYCGWLASVYDNRACQHGAVHRNYPRFFSRKEYLLVDSTYQASDCIIPAYKKGRWMSLARDKEYFNTALARLRIKSEHCLEMLKGHYQYLKRIRAQLKDVKSKRKILAIIDVACVLHNLVIDDMIPQAWIENENEQEVDGIDIDSVEFVESSRKEQLLCVILESSPY